MRFLLSSQMSQFIFLLFLAGVLTTPVTEMTNSNLKSTALDAVKLETRGCSLSNSGTHCLYRGPVLHVTAARAALSDLLAQCSNGELPRGAKRVASRSIGGIVAYACNSFCRTEYMPCQDAEWSINRVINNCLSGAAQLYEGWDSQETRGTWYGLSYDTSSPCGYGYSGRGPTY